jgi:hypothetical protein
MVFNLENQFDVWEHWPGGSGCAYIESLLVSEEKVWKSSRNYHAH